MICMFGQVPMILHELHVLFGMEEDHCKYIAWYSIKAVCWELKHRDSFGKEKK